MQALSSVQPQTRQARKRRRDEGAAAGEPAAAFPAEPAGHRGLGRSGGGELKKVERRRASSAPITSRRIIVAA
jgi:hypothetical protein